MVLGVDAVIARQLYVGVHVGAVESHPEVLEQLFAELQFDTRSYAVVCIAEGVDGIAAFCLLDAFDGVLEIFEIERGGEHVVGVLREEVVTEVHVVVVAVLYFFVTAQGGAPIAGTVEEGCHLDEGGTCHGARGGEAEALFRGEVILDVESREEVGLVQFSGARRSSVGVVVHTLTRVLYAHTDVDHPACPRVQLDFGKSGKDVVCRLIGVACLHVAVDHDGAVLHVGIVQVAVGIVDGGDVGIEVVEVVVEVCTAEVTFLVLVGSSEAHEVVVVPAVAAAYVAHQLVFFQFAEVTHGLLLVEQEEACRFVRFGVTAEHHLAAVRLVAACHAIGGSPVECPSFGKVMMSGKLVVEQAVGVEDAVAAQQVVAFRVEAAAVPVFVFGIPCIEEGVRQVVRFAEGVAQAEQPCEIEPGGEAVVVEVVLDIALFVHGLHVGIVEYLRRVADAE